jgi:hypothetical protein
MNKNPEARRDWVSTFYRDLKELVDTTFPKTCTKCGKVYPSKEAFLTETIPVKDITLEDRSGLFSLEGGPIETAVGLFRNCICGTTLMADFKDRRDNSDNGQVRRLRFAALMDKLSEQGVPRAEARLELLKVLHGETSGLIDELLDDVKLG